MNSILKALLFMTFFIFSQQPIHAQEDKTVSLTVSGTGKTLEEAKSNALRSAIEQAFGAFISSKTEILNDNLVKDEIVSVANGNIQKFEIVSQVEIPNNGYAMTLNATVSISKLTSFAQSKGVSIEIKGGLFAANIIQQELNEKAELKAVQNIIEISEGILKKSFDYSIQTNGNPTLNNGKYDISLAVKIKLNSNFNLFIDYFQNSLLSLSMSKNEIDSYLKINKPYDVILLTNVNGYDKIYLRNPESITLVNQLKTSIRKIIFNFEIDNNVDKISNLDNNKYNVIVGDIFRIYIEIYGDRYKFPSLFFNTSYSNESSGKLENISTNSYFNGIYETNKSFRNSRFPQISKIYDDDIILGKKFIFFNFLNFNKTTSYFYNQLPGYFKDEDLIITMLFSDTKSLEEIKQLTEYKIKSKE
jgi:hypothetical protein